ncbi:ClpP family protease [Terrisporobacter sp.]|uniref:ClpP family protease n=1 Tax=Terrisporobacter sp. TaxID=1965305 RepID=UPI0026089D02|nr:ATP-dependent Clp protease proteolytic subunit [Terrisporobacter sp.]
MIKNQDNTNQYINDNSGSDNELEDLNYDESNVEEKEVNKAENRNNANSNDNSDEDQDNDDEKIQDIKQMGVSNMPSNASKEIQCITIIGEIEGHFVGNPQKKSTKYEHIIPLLYSVEESSEIKGILVILNTVGGDVEAGLAMAELINSISKKVVTLVLGGSHSIGVPLATAGDYSYIAPTATMIVHPIRTNGLVIGVNETFEYFKKMQERIVEFITRTSNIERGELERLMHAKDELVSDVGSVLIGKEAVECGLIDEVGGLKEALAKLRQLIKDDQNQENK